MMTTLMTLLLHSGTSLVRLVYFSQSVERHSAGR